MEPPTIGQSPDETAPSSTSSTESLSLRPSRLPLLWLVPAVALSIAVVVTTFGNVYVGFLNGYLAVATVSMVALVGKLLFGRTSADADGLRNRLLLRTRVFPWRDVNGFSVASTLFGRTAVVHLAGGKRFHLAAPRSGLLAGGRGFDAALDALAALSPERLLVNRAGVKGSRVVWWVLLVIVLVIGTVFARPWLEPRWPLRDEATALPEACAIADEATARRLLPDIDEAQDRDREYSIGSECSYRSRKGSELKVELALRERDSSIGATEKARDDYQDHVRITERNARDLAARDEAWTFEGQRVPGIGDQAWRSVLLDARDKDTDVKVWVRYANVLIEVDYQAKRPKDEMVAAAEELARAAVKRIELR